MRCLASSDCFTQAIAAGTDERPPAELCVTPLVKELTQYARYAVRRGRLAATFQSASAEWRRRRLLRPRELAIAAPRADRPVASAQLPVPPLPSVASAAVTPAISWDVAAADPELVWRVHRFGWVLEELAATRNVAVADAGAAAILEWINHPASKRPAVLDSYSISERLANWSLLSLLRDNEDDRAIRASVDAQAARLVAALEEYGHGYTNNHFLNNLRALFWYASAWNAPEHRCAAARLAADALPRLFSDSGFLRESSSHYHLLLTRSVIEMRLLAAIAEDRASMDVLDPWVARTTRAAAFLLAGKRVPLIGDISPDFAPDWVLGLMTVAARLTDVPVVEHACPAGWHTLWTGDAPAMVPAEHLGWSAYADAGWYRLTVGRVGLLWYVAPEGAVGPRSHGHIDLGSFELAWNGAPLVVDPGRSSYSAPEADGRDASSHNTITIDDYAPMLGWGINGYPTAMDRDYWDPRATVEGAGGRVTLTHHGFERLERGLSVSRRFDCESDRVVVADEAATGAGRIVESRLHFAPGLRVEGGAPGEFRIHGAGPTLTARWDVPRADRVGLDVLRDDADAWFSPRYGERVVAAVVRLRVRTDGRYQARLVLEEAS